MTAGEYTVANNDPSGKLRNNYYKSFVTCVLAIFLFILLCVILLIIMFAVRWQRSDKEVVTTETPTTTTKVYGYGPEFGRFEAAGTNSTVGTTVSRTAATEGTTRLEPSTTLEPLTNVSYHYESTKPSSTSASTTNITEATMEVKPIATETMHNSTTNEPSTVLPTEATSSPSTAEPLSLSSETTTTTKPLLSVFFKPTTETPSSPSEATSSLSTTEIHLSSSESTTTSKPLLPVFFKPTTDTPSTTESDTTTSSSESSEPYSSSSITSTKKTTTISIVEITTRDNSTTFESLTSEVSGGTLMTNSPEWITDVITSSTGTVDLPSSSSAPSTETLTGRLFAETIGDRENTTTSESSTLATSEDTYPSLASESSSLPSTTSIGSSILYERIIDIVSTTNLSTVSDEVFSTTDSMAYTTTNETDTTETLSDDGIPAGSISTTDETLTSTEDISSTDLSSIGVASETTSSFWTGISLSSDVTTESSTEPSSSSLSSKIIISSTELYNSTETTESDSVPESTTDLYTESAIPDSTSEFTTVVSSTEWPKSAEDICNTVECKRVSARMLAQMGHEYDPCDNFYMYACGGMHSDPFLLPYDYTKDVKDRIHKTITETNESSPEAFQKFANFHNSCYSAENVDLQFRDEVITLLGYIGEFNQSLKKEDINFTHFFTEIIKLHRPLLFDIILDVDDSNNSKYILKMTTPIHENPFKSGVDTNSACNPVSSIKNGSNLNEVYVDFKNCSVFKEAGTIVSEFPQILEVLNSSDRYITNLNHLNGFFDLERWIPKFAEIEPVESKRRKNVLIKNYTLVNVAKLNDKYSLINWTMLMENLLGQKVPDDTLVQVYSEEYFDKVFELMKDDENITHIYNALLAAFVQQLYTDMVTNLIPDHEYCLNVASGLMEDVAAGAYLRTFDKRQLDSKSKEVDQIFKVIKRTLKDHLRKSDWIDSKGALLLKLDSMILEADGGYKEYSNISYLNNNMISVSPIPGSGNYVSNSIELLRRYRSNIYKSYLGNPRDDSNIWSFFSLPQDMNGVSIFGLNTVAIPYGMLASPFFHGQYPKYLLIAGIGHVIAHEVAHHFDNIGMNYSSNGERKPMLTKSAREFYSGMESCFRNEFNKTWEQQVEDGTILTFTPVPDLNREEQLADDIAISLVESIFNNEHYDWREERLPFLSMNNTQAFYLHLAQGFCRKDTLHSRIASLFEDEHLPSMLRVNHMVSQSKEFPEAFNCKAGSRMNPTSRCEVFPALTAKSKVHLTTR